MELKQKKIQILNGPDLRFSFIHSFFCLSLWFKICWNKHVMFHRLWDFLVYIIWLPTKKGKLFENKCHIWPIYTVHILFFSFENFITFFLPLRNDIRINHSFRSFSIFVFLPKRESYVDDGDDDHQRNFRLWLFFFSLSISTLTISIGLTWCCLFFPYECFNVSPIFFLGKIIKNINQTKHTHLTNINNNRKPEIQFNH